MAMASYRRSRSPPASRQRLCSPPSTTSSLYFPPELIPNVGKRLTNLQDLFSLRACCRTYRALLPLTPSIFASQAPLLVAFDRVRSDALFRHPTLRRVHRFSLPRTALAGHGYAVTKIHPLGCRLAVYETEGFGGPRTNFSIVHLLTGERACLSSPPNNFSRVLLSGDLVLTWKRLGRTVQYCRLGAANWQVAVISGPYFLEDLINVNGKLYALVIRVPGDASGRHLAAVELAENKNLVELVFLIGWDRQDIQDMHLAECYGALILVCTVAYRVYRVLKWKSKEAKWASITSLRGCTLFLAADNHFVGCLGPNHRGIRGDSIYVAEDNAGGWYEYSLGDGSSEKVDAICPGGEICSVAWVFPSMY